MRNHRHGSERDFTAAVIELAQWAGWLVHHSRPARRGDGWATHLSGDAGLPDLVMAKGGVVLLVELKMPNGRLTAAQQAWVTASGAEVWRPDDWPAIEARLTGRPQYVAQELEV